MNEKIEITVNSIVKRPPSRGNIFTDMPEGLTVREIADKLNDTSSHIRKLGKKYGYVFKNTRTVHRIPKTIMVGNKCKNRIGSKAPTPFIPDKKWKNIFENLESGLTAKEIAEKAGCSLEHVYRKAKKYGYAYPRDKKISNNWKEFFDNLEAGLTLDEISIKTNCTISHMSHMAKKFGYKIARKQIIRDKWEEFFNNLEQGLNIEEIAVRANRSNTYMSILAKKFGYEYIKSYKSKIYKYDWDSVSWEEQDCLISDKLGCTRERVRQKRIELKKSESPFKNCRRCSETKKIKEWTDSHMHLSGKLFRHEVIAILKKEDINLTVTGMVNQVRRYDFLIKEKPSFYNWPINWDLPNVDIERIWKLWYNSAATTRHDYNKGKRWTGLKKGSNVNSPEYLKAVEKEEKVAENYLKYLKERKIEIPWHKSKY